MSKGSEDLWKIITGVFPVDAKDGADLLEKLDYLVKLNLLRSRIEQSGLFVDSEDGIELEFANEMKAGPQRGTVAGPYPKEDAKYFANAQPSHRRLVWRRVSRSRWMGGTPDDED